MTDKKQVIFDIERCICHVPDACRDCSKYKGVDGLRCMEELMADAYTLLKDQEAVEPILEQDSMVCGVCGHEVIWQKMLGDGIWADEELNYCPHCGRKVNWDG